MWSYYAENKKEAMKIYAKYYFESEKVLRQSINDRKFNMSFWEEFFIDIFNDRGECLVDTQKDIHGHLNDRLNLKYKQEIAEDLYNFYVDKNLRLSKLKEETKITVALEDMEMAVKDNYLIIEEIDNIDLLN